MSVIRLSGYGVLGICGLLLQTPACAQDPASTFIEPPPWQEQAVSLPAYPADIDLLSFPVDMPAISQTFTLDAKSLSVGVDRVVRYTVAITSTSGARNVLYEGIRCEAREFRTYAYGEASQRFRPALGDKWNNISAQGWGGFRVVLLRDYLCDAHLSPYHLNEIKRRLSQPPSVR